MVLGLQPAAEKLNKQWGNGQIWLGGLLEVKEGDSLILYYQKARGAHVTGKKVITTDRRVPGSAHVRTSTMLTTLRGPVLLQEKEEAIREPECFLKRTFKIFVLD